MLYNVHTHHHPEHKDIVYIENRYKNFDSDITGRKVSMGLHPWYLDEKHVEQQLAELADYAKKPEVLAIGECGLDKLATTDWQLQLKVFRLHIILAEQINKPLIIHCVKAFGEVLAELKHVKVPVIFHGINNKPSVIQPVIDSGHYLSFGKSLLSYNEIILDTFRITPLKQVFLETDDTDIDIREIYKSAARIKNITEIEIVLQLEKNFLNVFRP